MTRLCIVLILCGVSLSACRYWVLYEFAEQFCEFEEYLAIDWQGDEKNKQVSIQFNEPILERDILLRYLNAEPFLSINKRTVSTKKTFIADDKFAIQQTDSVTKKTADIFKFNLTYHSLDEHSLLESAYLDSKLSQLFSPALVEPILRSLCSDDYNISLKRLDMRFTLSALPKRSLPTRQHLITIFGQADETIVETSGEQTLSYAFDFMAQDRQQIWQPQHKPISMLFGFDAQGQLNNLYIHYHKYSYWLDVETLSGRLLVIRRE